MSLEQHLQPPRIAAILVLDSEGSRIAAKYYGGKDAVEKKQQAAFEKRVSPHTIGSGVVGGSKNARKKTPSTEPSSPPCGVAPFSLCVSCTRFSKRRAAPTRGTTRTLSSLKSLPWCTS